MSAIVRGGATKPARWATALGRYPTSRNITVQRAPIAALQKHEWYTPNPTPQDNTDKILAPLSRAAKTSGGCEVNAAVFDRAGPLEPAGLLRTILWQGSYGDGSWPPGARRGGG